MTSTMSTRQMGVRTHLVVSIHARSGPTYPSTSTCTHRLGCNCGCKWLYTTERHPKFYKHRHHGLPPQHVHAVTFAGLQTAWLVPKRSFLTLYLHKYSEYSPTREMVIASWLPAVRGGPGVSAWEKGSQGSQLQLRSLGVQWHSFEMRSPYYQALYYGRDSTFYPWKEDCDVAWL